MQVSTYRIHLQLVSRHLSHNRQCIPVAPSKRILLLYKSQTLPLKQSLVPIQRYPLMLQARSLDIEVNRLMDLMLLQSVLQQLCTVPRELVVYVPIFDATIRVAEFLTKHERTQKHIFVLRLHNKTYLPNDCRIWTQYIHYTIEYRKIDYGDKRNLFRLSVGVMMVRR